MVGNVTATDLRLLRMDLARRSRWNIGYFASGLVFWLYVAVTGSTLPLSVARVYWLVGTFLIFPLAVAISRLCRADPFCKGNDLGELVGYTHMSVNAMSFPIVVAAFVYLPQALLLDSSVCTRHFARWRLRQSGLLYHSGAYPYFPWSSPWRTW
jgi:hypothetical protein